MSLFRSITLRMRNVSDNICREKQNTIYVVQLFFQKSYRLCDNVENYIRAGQTTDENMAHAFAYWITKATDTH